MLRNSKKLENYKIHATDETLGKAQDYYFDDDVWIVRYIIADTGKWLPGRQVLLSPFSVEKVDHEEKELVLNLNKEQVENSPPVYEAEPVSRQNEMDLVKYYGWPVYWAGIGAQIPHGIPVSQKEIAEEREDIDIDEERRDPHLRSTNEVREYTIQAKDGEIGHVEDFLIEDDSWIIRYIVVDTRNWLPGGRKVILSPAWIEDVEWPEAKVSVDLAQETIKNSPEYDPSVTISREYETRLYDHYGRPKYWEKK